MIRSKPSNCIIFKVSRKFFGFKVLDLRFYGRIIFIRLPELPVRIASQPANCPVNRVRPNFE